MDATAVIKDMCGIENTTERGVSWEIFNGSVQYTVNTLKYLLMQELELDDTTDAFNTLPIDKRWEVMTELLDVDTCRSYSDEIDFTQEFCEAYPTTEKLRNDYVFLQVHRGGDVRGNWSPWMLFRLTKSDILTSPEIEGTCTRNGIEYRISNWDASPSKGIYGITFMDVDDQPYPDNEDFLDDDVVDLHLVNTY